MHATMCKQMIRRLFINLLLHNGSAYYLLHDTVTVWLSVEWVLEQLVNEHKTPLIA